MRCWPIDMNGPAGIHWRLVGTSGLLALLVVATIACSGSEETGLSPTGVGVSTTEGTAETPVDDTAVPTITPDPMVRDGTVATVGAVPALTDAPAPVPTPTLREVVPIEAVAPVAVVTIDTNTTPTSIPTPTATPTAVPTASPDMLEAERADRAVLIALYNATNGANWVGVRNWLSDAPIDKWSGVSTYGTSRVIELRLWGRNLVGQIPSELGNLTYLRELNLGQNVLSGPIPPELAKLTNLDELYLSSQRTKPLTGCIPAELLLVHQNDLVSLRAPVCGAVGGSAASDRDALIALYNATDGANWEHNDNWLSDAPVSEWFGVETDASGRVIRLFLGGNELSGPIPTELGDLTNLGYLALSNNQLTEPIPPELGNLTSLTTLRLSGNRLSGPIPPEMGNFTGILRLELSDNQLTGPIPPEMGKLAYLRFLFLGGNQLSGTIPTELRNIVYLAHAFLRGNQLSGCIPAEWQSVVPHNNDFAQMGLPFCEKVPAPGGSNLSGDGAVLEALYNATDGENWLFRYKWLSDAPIGEWYGVTADEEGRVIGLVLDGNLLSGEIPTKLGQLSELKWLALGRNRLVGEIPGELGGLTNVVALSLSSNQLTGFVPPELGDLANLKFLILSKNRLTGCIPAGLEDIPTNDLPRVDLPSCQ